MRAGVESRPISRAPASVVDEDNCLAESSLHTNETRQFVLRLLRLKSSRVGAVSSQNSTPELTRLVGWRVPITNGPGHADVDSFLL
jgi:hypothetical protein